MKKDSYNISVYGFKGCYECKVDEVHNKKETYYLVDILTPNVYDDGNTVKQLEYNIEMHIDCNTGNLKVKKFTQDIPADLLQIEQKLSDIICNRNQE